MKKITKAALVGGAAAVALAATVGVAAPANAYSSEVQITTVVRWVGGNSWLSVDYPGEGIVVEGSPTKVATDVWYAISGARIGADPIMGDADWIGCELYINGRLAYSDSAFAGDNTDANCVRILR